MVKIVCVIGAVLTMFAYSVLAERKISASIQDRVGPNRVALPLISSIPVIGPFLIRLGFWQPIADGLNHPVFSHRGGDSIRIHFGQSQQQDGHR